ncbi:uncharacterized protein LACBIDRAFT_332142 [Laccaria bicolor S238N-H82]|uniref:Predicted protein n=1 Tax=Laccaria bicolor (strain S238N-H82 / ATCC MYA-4686) TaxID=486041 RepID=B0DRQ8_LACBS|nr:uncharacterized protein LACBIDRAFT_332142 [Laccaria bicolor S238N-H82]EDR02578.1 predicted protein [Laccaria bicolor S238N-H82]|eukprot:XP_001886622.1 predicted protein [Laccaria bicolor S238N-H82]
MSTAYASASLRSAGALCDNVFPCVPLNPRVPDGRKSSLGLKNGQGSWFILSYRRRKKGHLIVTASIFEGRVCICLSRMCGSNCDTRSLLFICNIHLDNFAALFCFGFGWLVTEAGFSRTPHLIVFTPWVCVTLGDQGSADDGLIEVLIVVREFVD